jgi:hypothetical protein
LPGKGTFLFKTHEFVEPVSNKALIFYGGLPTYISEIYAMSSRFY